MAVSRDRESEIARGCIIERPKVIYNVKTKKFVMWFHLELRRQGYRAARTGLAVADQITGPLYLSQILFAPTPVSSLSWATVSP